MGATGFLLKSELSLKLLSQLIEPNPSPIQYPTPFAQGTATSLDELPQASSHIGVGLAAAVTSSDTDTIAGAATGKSTEQIQCHQLTIDLANQRAHLSRNDESVLAEYGDSVLSIEEWLAMLEGRYKILKIFGFL